MQVTAPRENGRIIVIRGEKYAVRAAGAAGRVRRNENSYPLSAGQRSAVSEIFLIADC